MSWIEMAIKSYFIFGICTIIGLGILIFDYYI